MSKVDSNPTAILLTVAGIAATFIATFLGVFLANTVEKKERDHQEKTNYYAYLTVMCEECRETFELNRDIDPESKVNEIRGGPFLFSAAAQNTKNLIFMEDKQVVNLMRLITRSGYHSARYHELIIGSPRVFRAKGTPTPNRGESPQQFQQRYHEFAMQMDKKRIEEARTHLTSWKSEFNELCKLLEVEREKAKKLID